jgi:hypothetical protein
MSLSSRRGTSPLAARDAKSRGQSLVEFALLLPVALLLVLFALDFGRVFLGWISLNNMARVGADYAARHPDAWANGTTANTDEYVALIRASYDTIDCAPNPATPPPPSFSGTRQPGDRVTVNLDCDFTPLAPGIRQIFGGPIRVSASSSFPVTYGCLAGCTAGGGPGGTPAPPADNCRVVPDMVGLSVLGARDAWVAAGFSAANFSPSSNTNDPRTVDRQTVTEPVNTEGCTGTKRFVFASVTVSFVALPSPAPTTTCLFVPNLSGMTVDQARSAWTASGLGGTFTPATGVGDRVVTDQFTTPVTAPDDCVEPTPPIDTVQVSYGAALPSPPAQPCLVPSFSNDASAGAGTKWTNAGFTGTVTFKNTNKLPYTIKSQSLVGGTFVSCASGITLSNTGNTN